MIAPPVEQVDLAVKLAFEGTALQPERVALLLAQKVMCDRDVFDELDTVRRERDAAIAARDSALAATAAMREKLHEQAAIARRWQRRYSAAAGVVQRAESVFEGRSDRCSGIVARVVANWILRGGS